ncbi:MAG: methyltransferase domain-containing protein, partial [Desulfosalsimonadaceae bacterium]
MNRKAPTENRRRFNAGRENRDRLMPPAEENIDEREIVYFDHHGSDWWQPRGRLKALHDINPLRMQYIADRADPEGKKALDVGCGGGILSEALARAGARVTGIDLADSALASARAHREISALAIDYRKTTAEALA